MRVCSSGPLTLHFPVTPHHPSAQLPPLITDYKPPPNAEINKRLTFAPCPITQYPRLSTCLINIHIPSGRRDSSLLHHPSHIRPFPWALLAGVAVYLLSNSTGDISSQLLMCPAVHMAVPNQPDGQMLLGEQEIDPPTTKGLRIQRKPTPPHCHAPMEFIEPVVRVKNSLHIAGEDVLLHRSRAME